MSYAPADRDYYDADSHIMELPNFLTSYADPKIRDQIPEVSYSASLVTDEEVEIIMNQRVVSIQQNTSRISLSWGMT